MNKQNIIYGVSGLCIGLLVMWMGSCVKGDRKGGYGDHNRSAKMMHQMPGGTMMENGPMDMDSMMKGMTVSLEGKTGDVFDKAFLSEMVVHHEGAVAMAKQVLATSKRPELIKLANDIITAQTMEIEMMRGWEKNWFK